MLSGEIFDGPSTLATSTKMPLLYSSNLFKNITDFGMVNSGINNRAASFFVGQIGETDIVLTLSRGSDTITRKMSNKKNCQCS